MERVRKVGKRVDREIIQERNAHNVLFRAHAWQIFHAQQLLKTAMLHAALLPGVLNERHD